MNKRLDAIFVTNEDIKHRRKNSQNAIFRLSTGVRSKMKYKKVMHGHNHIDGSSKGHFTK